MPATILVVEDNDDIREAVADLLAEDGYSVVQARNGAEALVVLKGDPKPALIILDIRMPVMDGCEFLRIKETADARLAAIPVLVVSAHATVTQVGHVIGLLRKPIDARALVGTVRTAVGS